MSRHSLYFGQAVPDQSKQESVFLEIIETLYSRFILGWTHYVTLLTVKNPDERNFYELEALENGYGKIFIATLPPDKTSFEVYYCSDQPHGSRIKN